MLSVIFAMVFRYSLGTFWSECVWKRLKTPFVIPCITDIWKCVTDVQKYLRNILKYLRNIFGGHRDFFECLRMISFYIINYLYNPTGEYGRRRWWFFVCRCVIYCRCIKGALRCLLFHYVWRSWTWLSCDWDFWSAGLWPWWCRLPPSTPLIIYIGKTEIRSKGCFPQYEKTPLRCARVSFGMTTFAAQ